MERAEKRNCSGQLERRRSVLEQRPALHWASAHSDPERSELERLEPAHSRQEQFAGPMPAGILDRGSQHPAEEEALRVALRQPGHRRPGQQFATLAREAEGTRPRERGPHKRFQTTQKQLEASTHQSFGQYPSLCAIQQRGSFQSGIGGSAFMINHPDLPELACCFEGGYDSMRAQSSGLDGICSPVDTITSLFLASAS